MLSTHQVYCSGPGVSTGYEPHTTDHQCPQQGRLDYVYQEASGRAKGFCQM